MKRVTPAMLVALASALLGACDGTGEDDVEGTGIRDGESSPGTALFSFPIGTVRAIDPDRLQPVLTLDGVPVTVERRGVSWVATFGIEPLRVVTLVAEWRYTLENGGELVVARSRDQELDGASSVRSIRVSDYVTSIFDEDEDGIDNLTEIADGTDPLIASSTARVFPLELDVPELVRGIVPADDLIVEATLDGLPVALSREGDRWIGSVAIDDGESHRYRVIWSTIVRDTPIVLLNSATVTFTRGTPAEELRIDVYADSPHDADGDGLSNLAEIFEGSDPLVAGGRAPGFAPARDERANPRAGAALRVILVPPVVE